MDFTADKRWVLIDGDDLAAAVDEMTLLDTFSAWNCWMAFLRLLSSNQPATMTAYFDDEAIQEFKVIRAEDLNDRCTFENPLGLEQRESRQ